VLYKNRQSYSYFHVSSTNPKVNCIFPVSICGTVGKNTWHREKAISSSNRTLQFSGSCCSSKYIRGAVVSNPMLNGKCFFHFSFHWHVGSMRSPLIRLLYTVDQTWVAQEQIMFSLPLAKQPFIFYNNVRS
jgi:hypothetical protein